MTRSYYSSRKHSKNLSINDLHSRLVALFNFFREKDYFKEKTSLTANYFPDSLKHEAAIFLAIEPFPLERWPHNDKTEDHIFDMLEFLYDRVSKPGVYVEFIGSTGGSFTDYDSYNEQAGKDEFKNAANAILIDWKAGFELSSEGNIRALGSAGLQYIFDAEVLPFDQENVDDKVLLAISKWRSRHRSIVDMKESVRLLADVFEYLKKSSQLNLALDGKDSSDLFNIANNFAIRHHDPKQKSNYDPFIWYSWMFHFYLATYHASIRLIYKKNPSLASRV
jgi:hypothetical protein